MVSKLEEDNGNLLLLDGALRRNTALFDALLANSADGVMLTGADRRILRVVRGLLGFTPGELNGALLDSLVLPEFQEILVAAFRRLLDRSCRKIALDMRAPRADGFIACISGTLTDMLDDPNVQAIVFNYRDISRLKRGELP